ncbi:hypothetical protein CA85_03910 [Allorhodopirellula solitaria]|uniref:Uncharacterized protein n=1 Tax=Allorhodopirellula solitaria TaxID=2527987 RepID=A0A5C5YJN4_9BACT|nr:hypothetical protein CA85_03910 [Allorhodopirellula solitaria]
MRLEQWSVHPAPMGACPGLFNLWGCDPFRLIFMEVISVLISPSRAKLGRVEKRAFSEFLGEGSVRVLQRLRGFPSAGPLPDEASPVDPPQTSFGEGEVKKLRKTYRASTPKIEQPRLAPHESKVCRLGFLSDKLTGERMSMTRFSNFKTSLRRVAGTRGSQPVGNPKAAPPHVASCQLPTSLPTPKAF